MSGQAGEDRFLLEIARQALSHFAILPGRVSSVQSGEVLNEHTPDHAERARMKAVLGDPSDVFELGHV